MSQHTPAEIKAANAARNQLKQKAKKEGKKKVYKHIQDERVVKQPRTSYTYFLTDRFASGDMKHMKIGEVGALIGREWKALSAAEKKVCQPDPCYIDQDIIDLQIQPYEDKAAKDKIRYVDEYTTVYGSPPAYTTKKATKKAT